jgi:hypothetical protein
MIYMIHIFGCLGCIISSIACFRLGPIVYQKYNEFDERDDIEYEFSENSRENNDFVP